MSKHKSQHQPNESSPSNDCLGNKEGHRPQTEKPKKRFWRDWEPMEKFTFVIAVFSVIYSIVTFGLYTIAKNTLVVSQRAFIYAKQANVLNSPHVKTSVIRPPNTPIEVDVTFKNSGQTVANKQRASINFLLNKEGIPSDFDYPVSSESQPILVPPQTETHLFTNISEKDLSDVEKGKMLLFVYGDVSYEDVFGTRHKTEYCFQYLGYSLQPGGELEEYIFYNGPTHNCADDDCKD
jgi:hypothetical protein